MPRAITTLLLVPAFLAGCYRPSDSLTGQDASDDTQVETTGDTAADLPEETAADPVEDVMDAPAETAVVDTPTELPELPGLPVEYAPNFTLQDLNSNSPTFGDLRSVWGVRGKVLLIYFGYFS